MKLTVVDMLFKAEKLHANQQEGGEGKERHSVKEPDRNREKKTKTVSYVQTLTGTISLMLSQTCKMMVCRLQSVIKGTLQ